MLTKINKSADRLDKLRAEQKTELLNKEEDIKSALRFNEFLENVKSDFDIKDKQSQISATRVILTA